MITTFMILAGTNFALHFRLLTRKIKSVFNDSELRTYLAIFAISSPLVAWDIVGKAIYSSFPVALRYAAFQTASILTTTGFATADSVKWPDELQGILLILMFLGAAQVRRAVRSR